MTKTSATATVNLPSPSLSNNMKKDQKKPPAKNSHPAKANVHFRPPGLLPLAPAPPSTALFPLPRHQAPGLVVQPPKMAGNSTLMMQSVIPRSLIPPPAMFMVNGRPFPPPHRIPPPPRRAPAASLAAKPPPPKPATLLDSFGRPRHPHLPNPSNGIVSSALQKTQTEKGNMPSHLVGSNGQTIRPRSPPRETPLLGPPCNRFPSDRIGLSALDLLSEAVAGAKPAELMPEGREDGKPEPRTYIDELLTWDILCGRGGRSNHHMGNKRYRQVVAEMRQRYRGANTKHAKTGLSRSIVEYVCNYGGRFVKFNQIAGKYFLLTKVEAQKKTSQALRETKETKWTLEDEKE